MVGVIEELIWISFGDMGQCMCFTCLFSALFKMRNTVHSFAVLFLQSGKLSSCEKAVLTPCASHHGQVTV